VVYVAHGREVASILSHRDRPTERFVYRIELLTRRDIHRQERQAAQAVAVGAAMAGAIVVAETGGHLRYDYQHNRRENRERQGRPNNAVTIGLKPKANHITSNTETV